MIRGTMISLIQMLKARGVTGMSQADLISASSVSLEAIEQFEGGQRAVNPASVQALRSALKAAGWGDGSDTRAAHFPTCTIDPHKRDKLD